MSPLELQPPNHTWLLMILWFWRRPHHKSLSEVGTWLRRRCQTNILRWSSPKLSLFVPYRLFFFLYLIGYNKFRHITLSKNNNKFRRIASKFFFLGNITNKVDNVSRVLKPKKKKLNKRTTKSKPKIKIKTNNIIQLLIYWKNDFVTKIPHQWLLYANVSYMSHIGCKCWTPYK